MRIHFLPLALCAGAHLCAPNVVRAGDRPNFIVMTTHDQGRDDQGVHGFAGDVRMPNLNHWLVADDATGLAGKSKAN